MMYCMCPKLYFWPKKYINCETCMYFKKHRTDFCQCCTQPEEKMLGEGSTI